MPYLVQIVLLGWIPFTLFVFAVLPPQVAVSVGIVGGWLILPPASIPISGFPDYDKTAAIVLGVSLATLIFQPNRLLTFKFRLFDVVILCWCACPFASSIHNGLGPYDGFSSVLSSAVRWGLPYFIGRSYLNTLNELRAFLIGVVVGGIIYSIPTLFEIRMSPLLRLYVYGLGGGNLAGMRFGGYRPFVFLSNGLEHGIWMTIVCVLAVWLWKTGALRQIGLLPMGRVLLPFLLVVTVLCRSSGALFLLVGGLLILWICTVSRSKIPAYLLLLVAPAYYALRISGMWSGDNLVDFFAAYFDQERAESLGYRFRCENLLMARALQQPLWGWGGWGRNRVVGPAGEDLAPTDGMWIIYFGYHGFVGLSLWTASLLGPPLRFLSQYPTERWKDSVVGPAATVAVLMGIYQVDTLVNGFHILPLVTAGGGLICISRGELKAWDSIRSPREDAQAVISDQASIVDQRPSLKASQSLPQVQLAERYLDLAKSLQSRGLNAEAKAALTCALDFLTDASSITHKCQSIHDLRWDCTNDLAWLLLTENENLAVNANLAVQLARQAAEANPSRATYWNTLGAALYRAGDLQSCINAIDRSITLSDGGTAFDYLYLALSYAHLGNEELARSYYLQAKAWIAKYEPQNSQLIQLKLEVTDSIESRFG